MFLFFGSFRGSWSGYLIKFYFWEFFFVRYVERGILEVGISRIDGGEGEVIFVGFCCELGRCFLYIILF